LKYAVFCDRADISIVVIGVAVFRIRRRTGGGGDCARVGINLFGGGRCVPLVGERMTDGAEVPGASNSSLASIFVSLSESAR